MSNCIDCGAETSGLRCKTCHGAELRRRALADTADADRALLEMYREEQLNGSRISARLGISKTRTYQKLRRAQEREKERTTA